MFLLYDPCTDFSGIIAIVSVILTVIQWVVPIILIVLGTVDLVKAVIAGKEEDIKKNQQTLVKRVIAAIIVFLVPLIVSIIMGMIGNTTWKSCWNNHKNDGIKELFNVNAIK